MYKIDYVHETIRKQRCQKAKVIYMRKKSIKSNKYYYEQLQHIEQGGGVGGGGGLDDDIVNLFQI